MIYTLFLIRKGKNIETYTEYGKEKMQELICFYQFKKNETRIYDEAENEVTNQFKFNV